ncbi:uncharacterized protein LOC126819117 isoform X2 [Patella vulgata]|uniref:uncharacterized protein LOC126819117 isoform X2 n=1 Tax=Patella vulgata TaxID=6465 RepID=UPI00217F3B09|nr:uncharacterized protein LOC126819117 isoform X2 [Patella vulgata]
MLPSFSNSKDFLIDLDIINFTRHFNTTSARKDKSCSSATCGCGTRNVKYCILESNAQAILEEKRLARYKQYSWVPMGISQVNSSSSPSVPYSTTDILYNGETGRSSLADDYSPKDLVYFDKDKSTRIRDGDIRRPASRNNSRRSLSLEKVSINGDKDELQPIKNSATAAKQNHFRPAGIRQSYLRGEQYHSNNSTPKINTSSHGIEKDDLVAMGTIWNPNSVAKNSMLSLNRQYSVNSVTTSSAAPIRRGPSTSRFSMGTGASRARDVEPKYTDPAIAAPASFQQRLIDLSALEAETVRWERSKKVKKKSKQDRDS